MKPASRQKPFVVPVFIPHAGCLHRCIFCNQTRTTGQSESLPAPAHLHDTITRFLSYRRDPDRLTEIAFYGGNFLGLPAERILSLLELGGEYVCSGSVHGLRFSTRPDTIDTASLELIGGFPVTTIELGVQSMNDQVLQASRRGHTAQCTRRAVSLLRRKSYRLGLQMMVGLPEDTPERSLASGKEIAALAPDFVRIYPTLVLEGSPLARWFARGRYAPMALDDAIELVRTLLDLFVRKGVRVVRMGLQPTDDLNLRSGVSAGPYHPAFGELVYAAQWRAVLQKWLPQRHFDRQAIEIKVHPSMLSRLRGHRNENLNWIHLALQPTRVDIHTAADLPADQVLINGAACHLFSDQVR